MKAILVTYNENEVMKLCEIVRGETKEEYIKNDTEFYGKRRHFHEGTWIWRIDGKKMGGSSAQSNSQLWGTLLNVIGFNQGYKIYSSLESFIAEYKVNSITKPN